MEDTFKLDGREFRGITESLTASQDDYLLGYLRRSGVTEILAAGDEQESSRHARAEQLLTQILLSGYKFHILAACLTEIDGAAQVPGEASLGRKVKKWSRAEADRNAAIFAEITDAEEKLRMGAGIVGLVLSFFAYGAKSSETSQKSSSQSETDLPTGSADQGTSEISPPSSASSPATTQSASMG